MREREFILWIVRTTFLCVAGEETAPLLLTFCLPRTAIEYRVAFNVATASVSIGAVL